MKFILSALFLLWLFSCQPKPLTTYLGIPVSEIEKAVNNHLDDWFPRIVDLENGGYSTNFEYNWERSTDQQKMLVTQSRDLWTASKAAQLFPANEVYKNAADHGFKFITEQMWDSIGGGFDLYFQPDKNLQQTPYKLIYGNAFALFALSEYAKINSSVQVKSWILKLVNWMDEKAHDHEMLGYYNIVLSEQLKDNSPDSQQIIAKIGWGNPEWKDQNTSIHLLEAFTTAYEVLPVPEIEVRLKEMLILVRDSMTQEDGSLKLYFTKNWQPIDYADSSRAFIMENHLIDHVSFGHNIETAYLLIDAAEKLYGKADEKTLLVAKKLTDHTLQNGFAPDYYGLFDKGYWFDGKMEIINRNKTWWSQAEALHTLALMTQYFPKEEIYKQAFQQMWKYIQTELYDHQYGGYYNNGLDETPGDREKRKCHNWKGPYHDGRALMKIWEYAKK